MHKEGLKTYFVPEVDKSEVVIQSEPEASDYKFEVVITGHLMLSLTCFSVIFSRFYQQNKEVLEQLMKNNMEASRIIKNNVEVLEYYGIIRKLLDTLLNKIKALEKS